MGDGRPLDEKLAPREFLSDFGWAAGTVLDQPGVIAASVALWMIPTAFPTLTGTNGLTFILMVIAAIFSLGWYGSERMFFLYRRENKIITVRELLASAPRFAGRFMPLAVLAGIVAVPAVFVAARLETTYAAAATPATRLAIMRLCLLAVIVPADLALTFVPSALVFTTRSPWQALRIGLTMIRQTWPRSGLYVLCPPLALNMLNIIYPMQIPWVRTVTTAVLALLALIAKGATAAFYLRERSVSFGDAARLM